MLKIKQNEERKEKQKKFSDDESNVALANNNLEAKYHYHGNTGHKKDTSSKKNGVKKGSSIDARYTKSMFLSLFYECSKEVQKKAC